MLRAALYALEVLGGALIVYGVWLWSPEVALVAAGIIVVLGAIGLERELL